MTTTQDELLNTILDLKARNEQLATECSRRFGELLQADGNGQQPSEATGRALAEVARANVKLADYTQIIKNLEAQIERGDDAKENLCVMLDDLRAQLVAVQNQQLEVERNLEGRISAVSNRESDVQAREEAVATMKGVVDEECEALFYTYIADGWVQFAVGNHPGSLHLLKKVLTHATLKPSGVVAAKAWDSIGSMLSDALTVVDIGGVEFNRGACFKMAVEADHDSPAWNNLGCTLRRKETVVVRGGVFTKHQCFLKALEKNPQFALIWVNISNLMLKSIGIARIGDRDYTAQQCLLQALEINPHQRGAWLNLGCTLHHHPTPSSGTIINNTHATVSVDGQTYTRRECWLKALTINPKEAVTWSNIAGLVTGDETVVVHGHHYTTVQCCLKALELNPKLENAWGNLGNRMFNISGVNTKVEVNGRHFTAWQCWVNALDFDAEDTQATIWGSVGNQLAPNETVLVRGSRYTQQECVLKAIDIDPTVAILWNNLGASVPRGSTVLVDGRPYTSIQCRIQALNLDPTVATFWSNLGHTMSPTETVSVGHEGEFSQQQCLVRALELDPAKGLLWSSVGATIADQMNRETLLRRYVPSDTAQTDLNIRNLRKTVIVNGRTYTHRQCWLRALELEGMLYIVWKYLAMDLGPTETVQVGYYHYDKMQCQQMSQLMLTTFYIA